MPPRLTVEPLPVVDALAKFLDTQVTAWEATEPAMPKIQNLDFGELALEAAIVAVNAAEGRRARTAASNMPGPTLQTTSVRESPRASPPYGSEPTDAVLDDLIGQEHRDPPTRPQELAQLRRHRSRIKARHYLHRRPQRRRQDLTDGSCVLGHLRGIGSATQVTPCARGLIGHRNRRNSVSRPADSQHHPDTTQKTTAQAPAADRPSRRQESISAVAARNAPLLTQQTRRSLSGSPCRADISTQWSHQISAWRNTCAASSESLRLQHAVENLDQRLKAQQKRIKAAKQGSIPKPCGAVRAPRPCRGE